VSDTPADTTTTSGPHEVPAASGLERALLDHVAPGDLPAAALALRAMRFGRLVERQLQALLRPSRLERSEFSVLMSLLLAPPDRGQTPSELARTVVQTTSGMTKTVNRLEARHLVLRAADAADARSVVVTLTHEGRITAQELLAGLVAGLDDLLADVDAADRAALTTALVSVLPSLERAADVTRT
jgi:DNA-binding MarR family transcriptional regulator